MTTPDPIARLARLACLVALFSSTSCGQGSTPVVLAGHTLTPKDGVFWSGLEDTQPSTRVVIADQRSLCDRYDTADPCTQQAQDSTPGDGTFLVLTVSGQNQGDYQVASADPTSQASLSFVVRSGGAVTFSDHAASGQITFTDITTGAGASGHYAVKMASGTQLNGDFTSGACSSFDTLVQRIAAAHLSCATSFSPTTSTALCTCAKQSNTADCSRSDSTTDWECSCKRNGDSSRCSVLKTEANVCTQGNGCCDTSF
jgi:hypothetical protein